MSSRSLEQLFLGFLANGDELAIEHLLRRSAPPLRRLARRLGADADDAEDLIQETIVAAIEGADRYDPARPLLPWLKGILTFRAAKLARSRIRRRVDVSFAEAPEPADAVEVSPPAAAARSEFDDDVHAAIARLPQPYRAPLHQLLLDGRSPAEIARASGEARATVRVRLHRGLRRLRALLARWAGLLLAMLFGRTAAAGTRPAARAAVGFAIGVAVLAIVLRTSRPADPAVLAVGAMPTMAAPAADDAAIVLLPSSSPAPSRSSAAAREDNEDNIVVRVVDDLDAPVANVGLVLLPADGRDPVLHRRRAVTDAAGCAVWPGIAGGDATIASDRGPVATVRHPVATSIELVVAGGRTVRGCVVGPDDRPVEGACVWMSDDGTGPWRGNDVATSDAEGNFTLEHVPAGSFLAARHRALARSDVRRVAASDDDVVTLHLRDAGTAVLVRVLGPDGEPVRDAAVFVGEAMDAAPLWLADGAAPWREPPFEGCSDDGGVFRTGALAPGRHPVFVRATGALPHRGWVDVGVGCEASTTVRLLGGARVHGVVRDGAGMPLPACTVVLRTDDPAHSVDVTTSVGGAFTFECVPAGSIDVAARAAGHEPRVTTVDVAAGTTAALDVQLQHTSRVNGSLVRLDGGGLDGCAVQGRWPASAVTASTYAGLVQADGTFSFEAATADRPQLVVRLAGELAWRPVDAFVEWRASGPRIVLPADFAATASLGGTLTTDAGAPLAGARLFVRGESLPWAEVGRSDVDGNFLLSPLPSGRCTLFAETTASQLPSLCVTDVALPVGQRTVLHAAAPPCGAAAIDIVRADGEPLGDLVVTLVDAALQRRCLACTTASVRQVLVPGDYLLNAMSSRARWCENVPLRITAGATTTLSLTLPPATRRVLVPIGMPAPAPHAAARFVLRDRHGPWTATFSLLPDAPLRLAAVLSAGDYELCCTDDQQRTWSGSFACSSDALESPTIRVQLTR